MGKVKWDSALDQILLIKILEACDVNPTGKDFQSMSESWPAHLEKPTPRAISEHLFKIRKEAKKAINPEGGNASASASVSPEKANIKKKPAPKAKPATKAKGGKRKRDDDEEDSNTDDDGVQLAVKVEDSSASEADNDIQTNKSKAKKARNARSSGVPVGEPVFEGKVETEVEAF